MRWLNLRRYTGAKATNLEVARRIVRKIQGAQRRRECLMINCEDVEVSSEFLALLVVAARTDKIRFCGLPRDQQRIVASHQWRNTK
jgi:hypothetical protein